ncbi:hypothetical protein H257_06754 [Aphanomyces astaci]|uniref:Uncharacterized protein n=1 Tax=Aphanomyces astaci TaxID=112090 RepID=W4GNM2_APHAT|nr:hypothetical protein H257_06754 [Aphanomyces astaci]ETV80483.1 hypothetical protein H257_06754 [Aphanomyces astaci]|eukprot:XP_009830407.1 hypothetical protein H257_06754 [Aphanomyces astaci]
MTTAAISSTATLRSSSKLWSTTQSSNVSSNSAWSSMSLGTFAGMSRGHDKCTDACSMRFLSSRNFFVFNACASSTRRSCSLRSISCFSNAVVSASMRQMSSIRLNSEMRSESARLAMR